MTPEQRAREYAALFTHLGPKWHTCVPLDGTVDKHADRMFLTGVQIAKPEGSARWELVSDTAAVSSAVPGEPTEGGAHDA